MEKRKFEIIVLIIVIVFSFILLGIGLLYDLIMESKSYTLFLNPYGILKCEKWKCDDVSISLNKYNNKEYHTFINGNNIGENQIFYNKKVDKFYVFDKNNNSLYNNGSLFGYSGKAIIKTKPYEILELSTDEINYIKINANLKLDIDNIYYTGKLSFDFDNDGVNENVYQVSSGVDNDYAEDYFDYVIYEDDDNFYNLVNNLTDNENRYKINITTISSVMDIFDDGKYEFTLSSFSQFTGKRCNQIYRLKGKKFVPTNECN